MAKKTKGRVGRPPIHRLAIMGNIDGAGRVIAAVPLFQPGQPYPLGLSVQRLHGIGETGVVVRMVGADGNMASMVVNAGKDPATVQHTYLRDVASATTDPDPTLAPFRKPREVAIVDAEPALTSANAADHDATTPGFFTRPAVAGDRSGPQPSDDASQEEIDAHDQRMMQVEGGE